MQQIRFEGVIQIPDNLVLVEKTEYETLQEQKLIGRYWNMDDLEEYTRKKRQWILENILYVPKFKRQLEKIVHYPNSQGDRWSFKATEMAKFLDDNFHTIFNT